MRAYPGEFLNLSHQLAGLERPSSFNQMSLENFFDVEAPIAKSEQYIGNTTDMVALKAGRDDAWLDRKIFQLLCKLDSAPIRVSTYLKSREFPSSCYCPTSAEFPFRSGSSRARYV